MASHALYPALDPDRIASQSRAVLTGLLRERLGFDGVVVTDSLEADAVVSRSSTPTAAARGIRAGVDLLLTTGQGSYLPVLRRLVREARADPAFRERLVASAARVRALSR
jgi:beta-N-acetylhexosaminidase